MRCLVVLSVKLLWSAAAIAMFATLSAFYPALSAFVLFFFSVLLCCPCLAMCLYNCTLGNIDKALNMIAATIVAIAAGHILHQNKTCGLPESGYTVISCDDVNRVAIACLVLSTVSAVVQLIMVFVCTDSNEEHELDEKLKDLLQN